MLGTKQKTFILIALLCVLLASAAAFAMGDYIIPKTWNYKITIEVETPDGTKTGSAIRQNRVRKELAGHLGQGVITYDNIGEAVVVDLEDKGILFYLFERYSNNIVENAFPTDVKGHWNKAIYYSSLPSGKKAIQTGWASFVYLPDIDNPEGMNRLDSADFEKTLGERFKLKAVTIEITDEEIDWKIDTLLNMIGGGSRKYYRQQFQRKG